MDFIQSLNNQANKNIKNIVLPESTDQRVLQAAAKISKEKIANVILIGDKKEISQIIDVDNIVIIDPHNDLEKVELFANNLFERRKQKGMLKEEAFDLIKNDSLFFGASLVASGMADGMVAGAINSTKNTIKSAIYCVGTSPDNKIVSSFFIMIGKQDTYGNNGVLFFADCGVNIDPSDLELAEIAITTKKSYELFFKEEAKIALLSFSTKGSADGASPQKVRKALEIIKEKEPNLLVDGELQFDASVIQSIGKSKAPNSIVAGAANILIFPNLDAGNIGYKIAERLGSYIALGPILQGLNKPINDLSRGCSVDDIVSVVAITAIQA